MEMQTDGRIVGEGVTGVVMKNHVKIFDDFWSVSSIKHETSSQVIQRHKDCVSEHEHDESHRWWRNVRNGNHQFLFSHGQVKNLGNDQEKMQMHKQSQRTTWGTGMNPTGHYVHMFEEEEKKETGNFIQTTIEILIKKK